MSSGQPKNYNWSFLHLDYSYKTLYSCCPLFTHLHTWSPKILLRKGHLSVTQFDTGVYSAPAAVSRCFSAVVIRILPRVVFRTWLALSKMNGLIIKILQVKSLKMVLASGFVIFVLFSCAQATDDDDFLYGKFPSGFKWGVSSPVYSPGPSGTQIK